MMCMSKNTVLISLLMSSILLGGCNTTQERKRETSASIQQAVDEGVVATPAEAGDEIPRDVSAALLPPINVQIPGIQRAAPEQRFDVKVRRAAARDFFMSLVEGTPYNMLVHPGVKGRISLDMKNVTVPEVMDAVRNVYGYDYKHGAAGYQVFPNTIHTRIYQVDYLAIQRAGTSQIASNPGQATQGDNAGGASQGGAATGAGVISSGSSIVTHSDADFWRELKLALETLIGATSENGRKVILNPQTGLVMVRAMPQELRTVEEYLENTEQVAQRQVIIEARILEITLDDNFQSGINWAALRTDAGEIGLLSLSGNSGSSFTAGSQSYEGSLSIADSASTTVGNGAFTLGLTASNFSMFIDLLKTQGDVHVLSNPRVSTVNNQKAVIKVGTDEYFVTDVDTNTTTGTSTSETVDVELTPFFTGVSLDVTPQISDAGDIVLHIHPTVTLVREQIKQIESTQGVLTMPLANSTVRESDTIIRARNGQIVVLGGLMENRVIDTESSVPLLGDIPGLGALFRNTSTETRKTELVILLKPVVVDQNGSQWSDAMRGSSSRFREMGMNMEAPMPAGDTQRTQVD